MHIYIHSFFFIRIYFIRISRHKAKAEILKRIDIILCVETSVNTIQFYVFMFYSGTFVSITLFLCEMLFF